MNKVVSTLLCRARAANMATCSEIQAHAAKPLWINLYIFDYRTQIYKPKPPCKTVFISQKNRGTKVCLKKIETIFGGFLRKTSEIL